MVVAVIEEHEEAQYRDKRPNMLTLILHTRDLGPGYVRWVIQSICTSSWTDGQRWSTPYFWCVDDNLSESGGPRMDLLD